MPPRWPRQPDRKDPEFRRLDDRMNFATHVALFAATNSGLWFFNNFGLFTPPQLPTVSLVWLALLLGHGLFIVAIAKYSDS